MRAHLHAYKQSILASETKTGVRHLTNRREFNRAVRQLRAGGIFGGLFKKTPKKVTGDLPTFSDIPFGILVFWASWCKPCAALKSKLEQVTSSLSKITVRRFNVDEMETWPPDVAKMDVQGVPTIVFVKNGSVVNKLVGDKTIDRLRKEIRESFPELHEDDDPASKECVKTCMRQKLDERMPRKTSGTATNKKEIVDQIVQDCKTECK